VWWENGGGLWIVGIRGSSSEALRVPTISDDTLLTVVEFDAVSLEQFKLLGGRTRIAYQPQISPSRTVVFVENGPWHVDGHIPDLGLPVEILNGRGINNRELQTGAAHPGAEEAKQRRKYQDENPVDIDEILLPPPLREEIG